MTFHGVSCAVLGAGRSGIAAASFLSGEGARVTVYEENENGDLSLPAGVRAVRGAFPAKFGEELLVRSPVLRPDRPEILASVVAGATLTSETELFLSLTKARTVGITGSDGKTTTAALTAELLRAAGHRVFLGGNNGTPLLPRVREMCETDFAVLELSSFQLMTSGRSPDTAVVTNLTPNHLNWHRDMAEYAAAKRRIFSHGARRLVLNARDAGARSLLGADVPAELLLFGEGETPALPGVSVTRCVAEGDSLAFTSRGGTRRVPCLAAFPLLGRHNLENLMAAACAVLPACGDAAMIAAATSFRGVPHRLETVGTCGGVRFINSSIDTSPTRTAAALEALGGTPVVIAGGRGKGIPLAPLGDALAAHARAVFCYGEAAKEITRAVAGRVPCFSSDRFAEAFDAAAAYARKGDTVLLSPGCTAFGEFRDFEARGNAFRERFAARCREREQREGTGRTHPRDGGTSRHNGS